MAPQVQALALVCAVVLVGCGRHPFYQSKMPRVEASAEISRADAKVYHYETHLWLNPQTGYYDGRVRIHLDLRVPLTEVPLLTFGNHVDSVTAVQKRGHRDREVVVPGVMDGCTHVVFESPLDSGVAVVEIVYSGTDEAIGFARLDVSDAEATLDVGQLPQ